MFNLNYLSIQPIYEKLTKCLKNQRGKRCLFQVFDDGFLSTPNSIKIGDNDDVFPNK